ncbi:uncharacterized protein DDB_G0287625, partial [Musca vetustissima]|uniref:uncharacterized protein DDB_G0287625 n=1 Tax=Musca vetustissima TaxID=27455 RepID=UPI002AB638DF
IDNLFNPQDVPSLTGRTLQSSTDLLMPNDNSTPLSITIDPLKYLGTLPEFTGDYRDLQTFINLIERVHPLLQRYDEPSQYLFSDIIKSKLKGKAREIIEINCQAQSWNEIKSILMNNFGERQSLEELFDKLKSVTFKTNSVDFYNDIKTHLRSLNNKTIITLGTGPGTNECAKNNMKTALNIFREKLPEPMKTIITCRNPDTLEIAMDILFQSGYAYYTTSNGVFNTTPKQFNQQDNNKHKQEYRNQTQTPQNNDRPQQNNSNNHNNFQGNKNYRPRPNQGYRNNNQINRNFNGNNYQPRDNYFQQNRYVNNNPAQPNFQNNWKPNFNH